ncbi:MAG: GGDEF domain-containing protein [Oligoflexales bacterium]
MPDEILTNGFDLCHTFPQDDSKIENITGLKELIKKLETIEKNDLGLINRSVLMDKISRSEFYLDLSVASGDLIYQNQNKSLSMIFVNIDEFKKLNDDLPAHHLDADQILTQIFKIYKSFLREKNEIYRYWGDQTVLVLPGTHSSDALLIARRLSKKIAKHEFKTLSEYSINLTVSMGVSGGIGTHEDGGLSILEAAKKGAFDAKKTKVLNSGVVLKSPEGLKPTH